MPSVVLAERGKGDRPGKLPVDPSGRVTYWDELLRGFGVRVSPDGVRSYFAWFRVRGKGTARLVTLGRVGEITLSQAREDAGRYLNDARNGKDRVEAMREAEREAEAEAQRKALLGTTFEELAERCLEGVKAQLAPRTLAEYRRTLTASVYPAVGSLSPEKVDRAALHALLDGIAEHAPVQANRTFAVVSRVFAWAVSKGVLAVNPCTGMPKPGGRENPRGRTYSNEEIRSILKATAGTQLGELVALLFHAGTRDAETRGLKWTEIDFERGVWMIPAARSKNRRERLVVLSTGAQAILRGIRERTAFAKSPFVFPGPTKEGFMGRSTSKTLRGIAIKAGLLKNAGTGDEEKWEGDALRLHDIRRTMGDRVKDEFGEATMHSLLGHTEARLTATYGPSPRLRALRGAADWWSEELARIETGETAAQGEARA